MGVKYTNENNQEVNFQQLEMLTEFNHLTLDDATNKVLKIDKFFKNPKTQTVEQYGGEVFISPTDNLNDVINNHIGIGSKGRLWIFYHNKQANNNGDVKWDYMTYRKGILQDQGISVFDNRNREIANCHLDHATGLYTNKRKLFFGDPSIFAYGFGDQNIPNIKFWYNDDDTIDEIFYYDDDYTLNEFIANSEIMAKFPWNQHHFFHSFNPILPT